MSQKITIPIGLMSQLYQGKPNSTHLGLVQLSNPFILYIMYVSTDPRYVLEKLRFDLKIYRPREWMKWVGGFKNYIKA